MLADVEGYMLSGYGDGGDAPDKPLELVPGAAEDAKVLLQGQPETRARFDRVADLVDGFETPFGTELLSTVHWVMTREHAADDDALERAVYAWGEQKTKFTPRQIRLAAQRLRESGWIPSAETARQA